MLRSLYLRHFRTYTHVEVFFSDKINFIRGGNAQGKTNLLEAVYLVSTGRSFRTNQLSDLIQAGESFFFLRAEFMKEGVPQTITLSFDGQTKKMEYNNTAYPHFTNLLGLLPTVLIAPEDIQIVIGSPSERRRFLDLHLAQLDPLYVHHLSRYYKALKQRNFLLKNRKQDAIGSWEEVMVFSATYIHQRRKELVETLQEPAQQAIQRLSGNADTLTIAYLPSFTQDYAKSRARETHVGVSLIGPHRDDLSLLLNGKEARSFASQGQKRSVVAALRLAEWEHFTLCNGTPPLFSIDDVGVHLDERRSHLLLEQTASLGQVFLTSPYPLLSGDFLEIPVEQLQVSLT